MKRVATSGRGVVLLLPLLLLAAGCTGGAAEPSTGAERSTGSAPFADCAGLTGPPEAAPFSGTTSAGSAATTAAPVPGTTSPGPAAPTAAVTGDPARSSDPAAPAGPGRGLPDLRLDCFAGGPGVALPELRGPAVLNVWASWCTPCRAELPAFQRLAARSAGQLHVIGVNSSDRPAAASSTGTDLGLTFPNLVDTDLRLQREVAPNVLPITLLVDGNGTIRHTDVSGSLDDTRLGELVRRHLGVAVPA